MPETLGGLALFASLLVPGFVYLNRQESRQAGEQLSSLRETGHILFASLACDLVVLGLFALVRIVISDLTPDVGAYIREGSAYWREHYAELVVWAVAGLAMASALAAFAAVPPSFVAAVANVMRLRADSPASQELARRQRPRIVNESAWSAAFHLHPDHVPHLGVTLEDGTYLFGRLLRFNPQVEETSDRSLVLAAPLRVRSATNDELMPLDGDVVVVSAGQVQYVTVAYLEAPISPVQTMSCAVWHGHH